MTDLWDPDRLSTAGWIMNRYSDHLRAGDRVRIGQEGDPCTLYRSSEDAPSARVETVEREVDGTVRFRAVLESSGAVVNLDNRNVAPDRIWELHPSQVDEFRERVERTHRGAEGDERERNDDAGSEVASAVNESADKRDNDDIENLFRAEGVSVTGLDTRVRDMEYRGTEIERTIGCAIRELAGDLLRMYRGEAPTFSVRFADKYDLALQTDVSYQGSSSSSKRHTTTYDDRHDFTEEQTGEEESRSRAASQSRHDDYGDDDVPSLASYTDAVRADRVTDDP